MPPPRVDPNTLRPEDAAWTRRSAWLVAGLFAVAVLVGCFGPLVARPFTEERLADRTGQPLEAIRAGLGPQGLKAQTFFNDNTTLNCESVTDPRDGGAGREQRLELFNSFSNTLYMAFGLMAFFTVRYVDVVVGLLSVGLVAQGVGSLLMHAYGYFAYWALDSFAMGALLSALASGAALSGWQHRSRWCVVRGKSDGARFCAALLDKIVEFFCFGWFWGLLMLLVLFYVDHSTLKLEPATSDDTLSESAAVSPFLLANPEVNADDLEFVLPFSSEGTLVLIIISAVPLFLALLLITIVRLCAHCYCRGRPCCSGAGIVESRTTSPCCPCLEWSVPKSATWVFWRGLILFGVAFGFRTDEAAAAAAFNHTTGVSGCEKYPADFKLMHAMWHFLSAAALYHVVVYISYLRAEPAEKTASIHYFPYYFVRDCACCSAGRCCGLLVFTLCSWFPWTTWEELSAADDELFEGVRAARRSLKRYETEKPDTPRVVELSDLFRHGTLGDTNLREKLAQLRSELHRLPFTMLPKNLRDKESFQRLYRLLHREDGRQPPSPIASRPRQPQPVAAPMDYGHSTALNLWDDPETCVYTRSSVV